MARKKPTAKSEFLFFDVHYEDGSQTSNRKIPGEAVGPFDRDDTIRAILEAQDREIEERSGRRRAPIKTIAPVKGR